MCIDTIWLLTMTQTRTNEYAEYYSYKSQGVYESNPNQSGWG